MTRPQHTVAATYVPGPQPGETPDQAVQRVAEDLAAFVREQIGLTPDQANAAVLAALQGDERAPAGMTQEAYRRIRADIETAHARGYVVAPINEWSRGSEGR